MAKTPYILSNKCLLAALVVPAATNRSNGQITETCRNLSLYMDFIVGPRHHLDIMDSFDPHSFVYADGYDEYDYLIRPKTSAAGQY